MVGCGHKRWRGSPLGLGLLVELLQHKTSPALYQFPDVGSLLLVLPAEKKAQCRCLPQSSEGPEEVAGLAALPVRALQHPEQETQLAGQAELLGTQVLLDSTAEGLHEIQHLDTEGQGSKVNKGQR